MLPKGIFFQCSQHWRRSSVSSQPFLTNLVWRQFFGFLCCDVYMSPWGHDSHLKSLVKTSELTSSDLKCFLLSDWSRALRGPYIWLCWNIPRFRGKVVPSSRGGTPVSDSAFWNLSFWHNHQRHTRLWMSYCILYWLCIEWEQRTVATYFPSRLPDKACGPLCKSEVKPERLEALSFKIFCWGENFKKRRGWLMLSELPGNHHFEAGLGSQTGHGRVTCLPLCDTIWREFQGTNFFGLCSTLSELKLALVNRTRIPFACPLQEHENGSEWAGYRVGCPLM